MSFPLQRLRRLRQTPMLRKLVRETQLTTSDLILPLFVQENCTEKTEIRSMPGQYRLSIPDLLKEATEALTLGIPAVVLFGIPATKDEIGSSGFAEHGIVQEAIRAIKKECPELLVITDVCIDEYTSHGHCGLIQDGKILNDETLEILVKMALSHVKAGADIVAPSDMMDGRVAAIREGLDAAGYQDIPIMSYAVKYASCFYGPFRDAADSTPQFGDRKSYQMDPANRREAMQEAISDVQECADIIMVKPAMPYLDILREIRDQIDHPLAAYQVSGEYAMIKAAAQKGWIDEDRAILESLLSIKRAGANMILTYFAKDAAQLIIEGEQR